jgi:hypothetical protein
MAMVSAMWAAPAAGQQQTERSDNDQIDAQSSPTDDEKVLLKAIEEQRAIAEEQRAIAEKQRAEATEQYRRAINELERVRRRGSTEGRAEMEKMRAQLEAARAQLAEQAARQQQTQQAQAGPLPENTILRIYQLQHVKPQNLAEVLAPIFRNNAPRIAVEERANSLIVAGSEQQLAIIEELARTLDREIPQIEQENNRDTLQVRIVWLLDIEEGIEPTDKLVSPQVIESLGELGFQHPKVVCQQITTLTFDGNREGQFNFDVPVLIDSHTWDLNGNGQIYRLGDGRFNLTFDLRFNQHLPNPGGGRAPGQARLGGSIYTPLAHYTVLGTTTFVAYDLNADEGPNPRQHLSAFVVYLDRAKEFPADGPRAENQSGRQR